MANSAITFLSSFLLCFVFLPKAIPSSNQTDFLSLLAVKSSLEDPQGALLSWNNTQHFCNWSGIRCSPRHPDRVVEINLLSQGLVGSLSPHIGNLSFLRTIILTNNTFHGGIPTEIAFLRRLEHLDFRNNSFSGPIPRNLSWCRNLVNLNFSGNKLSGNIPTELGFLSKLEDFRLSLNNLSGNIPPSIGNMTSLKFINLAGCGLEGEIPESLAQLRSMEFLNLNVNRLTGSIPSALFNISTLYYFGVAMNKLVGAIPPTIGLTLPNLTMINLWMNQFSGPLPVSISNASFLEVINFFGNNLTGRIPGLAGLTRLRSFIIGSNLIADNVKFISSLTNSTNLEILQVSSNLLTGSLPRSVANFSQLAILNAGTNNIHGNIPSEIGNLINLRMLLLHNNYLEGPIPESIGELSKLHWFVVLGNKLTNELSSSFGNLTALDRLYLSENHFFGNLPSSLGNCTNLQELDLSDNNFSGLIPREIMELSSVTIIFNLSFNNFEGSIPYEVGSLMNLGALDLSNNRLSGQLPASLSRCMSLQYLLLNENLLEGEIPSALSALKGLQALNLSVNNFSGPIPISLGELNLEYLNLSFNKLHGEVPVIGVFNKTDSIFLTGNEGLCGGVEELKLPPCNSVKSIENKSSTLLKILIPALVAGGICLMVSVFFSHKRRMSRRNQAASGATTIGSQFLRLSFPDLLKATGGFSESNLMGIGKFGSVYKGTLDDGETFIAVKVLNLVVRGASKSFVAECNALRHIRHRNLVKILSVCESIDFQGNDFKALVYEFKANGSLEEWLYHDGGQEEESGGDIRSLSMIQRLSIAIDIAQAIEYLHVGTDSCIVHGDLKPSNILLDHEMTASVGDFGLAQIVSDIVPSHESSNLVGIRGTIGYVPPEYGTSQLVSVQGDVYSYGIVLLEIFTNKRPVDDLFMNHENLRSFVKATLPDGVMEIVYPGLRTEAHVNIDTLVNNVCDRHPVSWRLLRARNSDAQYGFHTILHLIFVHRSTCFNLSIHDFHYTIR